MTITFIIILLALALVGVPLYVIVCAGTALCFYMFTPDHQSLSDLLPMIQAMEGLLTRQEFLAIPLFMAAGAIMTAGGIASRLINVAKAGLSFAPGGLAIAAVIACMFFAMISGSSPVTLIAVGSIMYPALIESKYPENFSLGLVTTAGSLGCLLPPAISMLIYSIAVTGSEAAVAPEDLFLAGTGPAWLVILLLSMYCVYIGKRKVPGKRPKFDRSQLKQATLDGFWALMLPILVLGGIYGGVFTPSEAGAVAMIYALVVTVVIYKELNFKKLMRTMYEAAALMGSLLLIIVLAFGLNEFLALIDIQDKLMALIQSMDLGPFGFLLLVNVVLIVLGALMDSISATLIFAPILAPVAWRLYGIDPVHFAIVFVVNMEIGYLMPPVATNLFVSAAVFKKPFGQVCRAVVPTLAITILALGIVMYVPTVSKALVNWKYDKPLYEPFPWDGKETPTDDVADGEDGDVDDGDVDDGGTTKRPDGVIDLGSLTRKHSGLLDDDDDDVDDDDDDVVDDDDDDVVNESP